MIKTKTKIGFINWFKYFEAYLEMARIGLLQLDQQKYPQVNSFKKDTLYKNQILLIPTIWSLKHSIELLLKLLDIRITKEFFPVHDNVKLIEEIKRAFSKLGIQDSRFLKEFIDLSDKYLRLKFLQPFMIINGDMCDYKNNIFRYPESVLKIEELSNVAIEKRYEILSDIKSLNKLSLKLYGEINQNYKNGKNEVSEKIG